MSNISAPMTRETCEFIPASIVLPSGWASWFWEAFSENAPFSWGDNDITLVTAERFADHAREEVEKASRAAGVTRVAWGLFLEMLGALGETYIDLEH